jgi:hypothetical protein
VQSVLIPLISLVCGMLILAARRGRVTAIASGMLAAFSLETILTFAPGFVQPVGAPADIQLDLGCSAAMLGGVLLAVAGLLATRHRRAQRSLPDPYGFPAGSAGPR